MSTACGGLHHIFEKPPQGNPTLIESLSWKPVKPPVVVDHSSFEEIFGELHFKERANSKLPILPLPKPEMDVKSFNANNDDISQLRSPQNPFNGSDNLRLCTEGLGFESSDVVEDIKSNDITNTPEHRETRARIGKHTEADDDIIWSELKSSRGSGRNFPPPISSIGKSGKPGVCFRSYRKDGRMVLKEVRIPSYEFLHAHREDGRLKMHFIHSTNEKIVEDNEEGCEGKNNIECNEKEQDERSDCYEDACSDSYEDAETEVIKG